MTQKGDKTMTESRYVLDNSRRYKALLKGIDFGITHCPIPVHSTTRHPCSSYGWQVWVDNGGNAYCTINLEPEFYTLCHVQEISEDEATEWERMVFE